MYRNTFKGFRLESRALYASQNSFVAPKATKQFVQRLYSSSPKKPRPHSTRHEGFSGKINQLKDTWKQFNNHPKFRTVASASLLLLYAAAAYAGVQYLTDTKYKATGAPNPYKTKEEATKERLESTGITDIDSSESTSSSLASTEQENDAPKAGIPAPRDTTEIFDNMAKEYDNKIWLEELTSHIWYRRRQVMKNVRGDVLEVSCGTGRNIPYFDPDEINSITFLDSSKTMLELSREKFTNKFPTFSRVQYVRGRAEDLATMAEKSGQRFDTIYETFGLCSHENPDQALKNFEKLLRKNGRIVLLEHGRSTYDSLNKTMDKKAEERVKEWGCRWNLDIDAIVRNSGLEVIQAKRYHFGSTYFYLLKRKGDE